MHENKTFFLIFFFSTFQRKSGVLIPDLYLYGIQYKPVLCKIDRKIQRKIIIFLKRFFGFFEIFWTRPNPTTLVWASAIQPRKLKQTVERLPTVHVEQWTGLEKTKKRGGRGRSRSVAFDGGAGGGEEEE